MILDMYKEYQKNLRKIGGISRFFLNHNALLL